MSIGNNGNGEEDFGGFFRIEELLEGEELGYNSGLKIDSSFKGTGYLNPRDYLIRREEKELLKRNARILEKILANELSLPQFCFLRSLLGRDWGQNKRAIPLRFRFYEGVGFVDYVRENLNDIKERIDLLLVHCSETTLTNRGGAVRQFISVPYNLATEREIIQIYEEVRRRERDSFPHGFFHPENLRLPKVLSRHLVERVLNLPVKYGLYDSVKPEHFRENYLGWMLEQYFGGDVVKALKNAYTERESSELYKKAGSEDLLREVFFRLDIRAKGDKQNEQGVKTYQNDKEI